MNLEGEHGNEYVQYLGDVSGMVAKIVKIWFKKLLLRQ
jgi:hypothetical protein